ncbi:MAG: hypothetical protein WA786_05095 [Acidimicrobiales bacterium]
MSRFVAGGRQRRGSKGRFVATTVAIALLAAPLLVTSSSAAPSPSTAIARALLNDALLPATARQVHPSTTVLCQCAGTPAVDGLTTLHRFYVVAGPPTALETYLTHHLPRGGHYDGSTGTSTTSDGSGIISITITYPASGPHVYLRQLAYSMTRRTSSTSWLRIDAQVVWIPSRTSTEVLSNVVAATVTGYRNVGLMGSSGDVTLHVTGQRLSALLAAFNSLPLGPQNDCMESLNGFTITFLLKGGARFRVANGLCAGSFDAVSTPTGIASPTSYVLADDACTFIRDVTSLFSASSVPGTRNALRQCEQWAKAARS